MHRFYVCKATDHQKLFATTEPKLTCVFLILHRYAWSVKYFELPTVNIFVGEESTKDILFPAFMKQQSILLKDCSIKSFSYLCFFFLVFMMILLFTMALDIIRYLSLQVQEEHFCMLRTVCECLPQCYCV